MRQDGVVLLVVVNDEEPQDEQAAEYATGEFAHKRDIEKSPGQRGDEKHGRGKDMPPAPGTLILRVRLRGED